MSQREVAWIENLKDLPRLNKFAQDLMSYFHGLLSQSTEPTLPWPRPAHLPRANKRSLLHYSPYDEMLSRALARSAWKGIYPPFLTRG